MLAAVAAAAALAPAATLYNLQCSDAQCGGCTVAQSWEEGKCYGVGNAPPYKSSQKATVAGGKGTLTSYTGDSCEGAATQTDAHDLDKCTYFTGQIWTKFSETAPLPAPRVNATDGGYVIVAHCGSDTTCDNNYGKTGCTQTKYNFGECFVLPGDEAPRMAQKCDQFYVDVKIWNLGDKDCSGQAFPNLHQDPYGLCSGNAQGGDAWEYVKCVGA